MMPFEAVCEGSLPQVLQQQMAKQLIQDQEISLNISPWPKIWRGVCQERKD